MATAVAKTQCFSCKKDARTFNCEGCSQNFCLNCLTKHIQILSQQLDGIENEHDQFRQTILEQKNHLNNHLLIEEIDQWEKDSINRVKQTAEQCRRTFIDYTSKSIIQIEERLDNLTKELKRVRQENEFNEIDLIQFKEKLKILEQELDHPSKPSIEQQSTPFINKIVVIIPVDDQDIKALFSDIQDYSSSAACVGTNQSASIERANNNLEDLKLAPVPMEQQKLSKSQKRRQNQKHRRANSVDKPLVVTEPNVSIEATVFAEVKTSVGPVVKAATTLNFNQLRTKPRKSVTIIDGQKMACNNEYFLVCPKNKLCLLDAEGEEYLTINRDFEVYDICWSTYLKRFLILSDKDLYSLDFIKETPLTTEISQFARNMDECTCYDNIFMVISDYGGAVIEAWDMKLNWKSIRRYKQPISCKQGQGVCSIRFSSTGMSLGVTLTEPRIAKAYFQLRNWQDRKVLKVVELPFYEGHCNHYILALPDDEFLVHKYSEKEMFLFDSNGQQKQMIRYTKGICSIALLMNDKKCLVVQTNRPDELQFYDL